MVRAVWFAGLVTALAEAQAQAAGRANVSFNTAPRVIDDLGTSLSVTPDALLETSDLLNVTGIEKRKSIDVVSVATVVGAGSSVITASNAALEIYKYIAQRIKDRSNQNSCTLWYGTDNDNGKIEGFAYRATTTGSNCDTTAIYDTILNAVRKCADDLNTARAVRGCCKFSHDGTWTGHLVLTGDPDKFPADTVTC